MAQGDEAEAEAGSFKVNVVRERVMSVGKERGMMLLLMLI